MVRLSLFVVVAQLAVACGGAESPPPRHARARDHEPVESLAPVPLRPLDADCQPDPSPLELPDRDLAAETLTEEHQVQIRLAIRRGREVLGIACTRAAFENEDRNEVDALTARIEQNDVVLIVDIAHCGDGEVTTAWVFDPALRFIGGVVDPQGGYAEVLEGKLVVGAEKRVIRGGTLVAP